MKKIWILVAAIAFVAGGAIAFAALRERPAEMPQAVIDEQAPGTPDTNPSRTGVYVNYSDGAMANADGRKLLFFHAPWCPQCVDLERDIRARGVPEGMVIFKVDYDTATELRQRYGVTLQTTIVEIDDEGNEIGTFVAYNDPSLGAVLNALGR